MHEARCSCSGEEGSSSSSLTATRLLMRGVSLHAPYEGEHESTHNILHHACLLAVACVYLK